MGERRHTLLHKMTSKLKILPLDNWEWIFSFELIIGIYHSHQCVELSNIRTRAYQSVLCKLLSMILRNNFSKMHNVTFWVSEIWDDFNCIVIREKYRQCINDYWISCSFISSKNIKKSNRSNMTQTLASKCFYTSSFCCIQDE